MGQMNCNLDPALNMGSHQGCLRLCPGSLIVMNLLLLILKDYVG